MRACGDTYVAGNRICLVGLTRRINVTSEHLFMLGNSIKSHIGIKRISFTSADVADNVLSRLKFCYAGLLLFDLAARKDVILAIIFWGDSNGLSLKI